MDTQIQSRLRLYSLIETHLRKAAADVKPITAKQLLSIPEVHRAANGNMNEVLNVLRTYDSKEVLVNFSEAKTSFSASQLTWKDDMPTPTFRVQIRRTKAEREAEAAGVHRVKPAQADLYAAMGPDHVLNKPTGQEAGYKPSGEKENTKPVPTIGELSAMIVRLGYQVGMHVNEFDKITLTVTEQ